VPASTQRPFTSMKHATWLSWMRSVAPLICDSVPLAVQCPTALCILLHKRREDATLPLRCTVLCSLQVMNKTQTSTVYATMQYCTVGVPRSVQVMNKTQGLFAHILLEPMKAELGEGGVSFVASRCCLTYVESVSSNLKWICHVQMYTVMIMGNTITGWEKCIVASPALPE